MHKAVTLWCCSMAVRVTVFCNARPTLSGPHQSQLRCLALLVVASETLVPVVAVVSGVGVGCLEAVLSGNEGPGCGLVPEKHVHTPDPGHSFSSR